MELLRSGLWPTPITSLEKTVFKWIVLVLALTIYLNIGWAFGTYYHTTLMPHPPTDFWGSVLTGPDRLLSVHAEGPKIEGQRLFMVAWPLYFVILAVSWFFYAVYYLLWLIFAGGIAKLLGMG